MGEKIYHLIIRFSDNLFGVGDVIARHNEVIEKYDAVWFGKLGIPLSQKRIDILNEQISKNITTTLYLIKGSRSKSTAYQAAIIHLTKEQPSSETNLFPPYYLEKGICEYIKTWIKVIQISPIEMSFFNNFRVVNSVFPIQETLLRSSSGHFFIQETNLLF